MNDIYRAAERLQCVLNEIGWSYCIIGGLAVQYWSEPRLTGDVDACVFTGIEGDERLIEDLLNSFGPRIPDAADFARRARVLLLRIGDIGCDVSLGALTFEEEMISRAKLIEVSPEIRLRLCTAEDLLVMKGFAGRTKDWLDAEGILIRQGADLDLAYVRSWLKDLCEARETYENLTMMDRLIEKYR